MMARCMCVNEERENRYSIEGEERRCKMCYEKRERDIEHMWNGCSEMRERERKERGEIRKEDGREIRWRANKALLVIVNIMKKISAKCFSKCFNVDQKQLRMTT
jgi:hypothetical protein